MWFLIYFAALLLPLWLLYNTFKETPLKTAAKKPFPDDFSYEKHPEVPQKLATAISFRTIAKASDEIDLEEMGKMVAFLEKQFPLMHGGHELVTVEKVNEYSRLYTVKGSDPKLNGFLMNAHMDVVPTENQPWTDDPFDTGIKDGWIFGRGAIDDKGAVLVSNILFLKRNYKTKVSFQLVHLGIDELSPCQWFQT